MAEKFKSKVEELGFTYSVSESGNIVQVHKSFTKGDLDGFTYCDVFGPSLIAMVPAGCGSVWGTDGGSVGGYVAVTNGNYYLNVSGVKKSFVNHLKKLK